MADLVSDPVPGGLTPEAALGPERREDLEKLLCFALHQVDVERPGLEPEVEQAHDGALDGLEVRERERAHVAAARVQPRDAPARRARQPRRLLDAHAPVRVTLARRHVRLDAAMRAHVRARGGRVNAVRARRGAHANAHQRPGAQAGAER